MHNYAILADCRKKWMKKRKTHGKMNKCLAISEEDFCAPYRENGYFYSEVSDKKRELCIVYSEYAVLM